MDDGKRRGDAVKDIGAMLDWIAARPELDKNRVVLSGASYGGWLALQAGIIYNDRIRGIIEGAARPISSPFWKRPTPRGRRTVAGSSATSAIREMRAYLMSISPVTRAAELKKPTFILHPGRTSAFRSTRRGSY